MLSVQEEGPLKGPVYRRTSPPGWKRSNRVVSAHCGGVVELDRGRMECDVRNRIFGGSLPNLEGTGYRASTMEEKISEIYLQLLLFMQNAARIENCVQTLAQRVAAQTAKIAHIEQIVGSLVARVTSSETKAAFRFQ